MARWVKINEEPCSGCGRRGDHGQRADGNLCWRCQLPEDLDPEQHSGLLETLEWERDNLQDTMSDVDGPLSERRFQEAYGGTRAEVRTLVQRFLRRNARDIERLEPAGEQEAA